MQEVDIAKFLALRFVNTDPTQIESEVLSSYEKMTGRSLAPGNPERLFLEALAMIIAQQSYLIDHTGKQNLLPFSSGLILDCLGVLTDTIRLPARPARTRIRFTIQSPLDWPVFIPSGTRITPDGDIVFATAELAIIVPGRIAVEVEALCTTPGVIGNGYVPGQIARMVDPVAHVTRVGNVTQSMEGADIESDAHYRARIQLAPESYTCAGPVGAYRSHVMAAHRDITEVAIWRPFPGHVDIRPVLTGGELPSAELCNTIYDQVSADDVRPLTDTVTVAPPTVISYEIVGHWYLRQTDSALLQTVTREVTEAVESYRLWQRSMPGRDIVPSQLIERIQSVPGVKRVVVESPGFKDLKPYELARETKVDIRCAGLEED